MKDKQIWVYAEISNGKVAEVYYELLSKAKAVADEMGDASIAAVALGEDLREHIETLKTSGAEAVYAVDHERLADYNVTGYSSAFTALIKKYEPYMVLIGATPAGAELGPTVAAKVRTGLAAHAIDIRLAEDRVNFMIPAFGGKVVSEIYIPETRPMMGSVRPGILEAGEIPAAENVEVIFEQGDFLADVPVMEELVDFEPAQATGKDIAKAEKVVVAAGRGVNEKAWGHLNELADKLEAPIGWSRSFVDTGIVPDESQMIGTSGKSIKPRLFIGFGISGASHFTVGIAKSKTVININKNKDAPIFGVSDYGVVADADRILTGLIEKFN